MINRRVLIRESFYPYKEYEGIIIDKIISKSSVINQVWCGGFGKLEVIQHIPTTHYVIELDNQTIKIVEPDIIQKYI